MNVRTLGIGAIIGAPFLFITYLTFGSEIANQKSALDGLYSLLYISGWLCSIIGLWNVQATGTNRWGRIVLQVQLLFLALADSSNFMLLLQLGIGTRAYFILDLFWPVSNIWMLATGITVVTARRLQGYDRFVPLLVGLWIPVTLLLMAVMGKSMQAMWASGLYSAVAWALLGWVVLRLQARTTFSTAYLS